MGEGTLLLQCVEIYLAAGHAIAGVASSSAVVREWAAARAMATVPVSPALGDALCQGRFDYLFSVGNHTMLPDTVIGLPTARAVNFHYGPLPAYAGVHAPVWALLKGERDFGVTWHQMTAGVDAGEILKQEFFSVPENETAAGINARCFEAGVRTFMALAGDITRGDVQGIAQDIARRTVFRRHDRPSGHCVIDWTHSADAIARLVRALDFGRLENTFASPRLVSTTGVLLVAGAVPTVAAGDTQPPGTILAVGPDGLVVATGSEPITITALRRLTGERLTMADAVAAAGLQAGGILPILTATQRDTLTPAMDAATRQEQYWLDRLGHIAPFPIPAPANHAREAGRGVKQMRYADAIAVGPLMAGTPDIDSRVVQLALAAAFIARLSGAPSWTVPVALDRLRSGLDPIVAPLVSPCVPLVVDCAHTWLEHLHATALQLREAEARGGFLVDLTARHPDSSALTAFDAWRSGVVLRTGPASPDEGSAALTLTPDPASSQLRWEISEVVPPAEVDRMRRELRTFVGQLVAHQSRPLGTLPLLDPADRVQMLVEWNRTDRAVEPGCIHTLFEAQVERTPEARAVSFRDVSLTYAELNQHANRLARRLQTLGVGPDRVVGVFVDRSLEMVVALLATLKAGGAYLPLDPAFPRERLSGMLEDTAAAVILTQPELHDALPRHDAHVVSVDLGVPSGPAEPNVASSVSGDNLAYVIFTSGSTGRPKGVMVEHRHVLNFFTGMDEHLGADPAGTWLSVTSISFDISVLELFWTLARGFSVVIQEDLATAAASLAGVSAPAKGMDFSLFYFSADARDDGGNRYRLLLEGAKYADTHGFRGVWTPERHFHAFGGLYPNPAVTGAAVAAITSNVRVRAGSVVLPLHNPIRVAEEWAVVDNLSQGRVELSFASGWHANDFALMPGNYADRREIMLAGIETIRRLWRGEAVPATSGQGQSIDVRTFPTPVQSRTPFWIAAAGSIDTFRVAGRIGANLLTNLLGQKIEDVATKIVAYRSARREAGHVGEGTVAVMLHTFVGPDLDHVRETVRQPMIDYLKSSTELVRQARWEFPAFANPAKGGVTGEVDLTTEDIDAMMAHAFERYFETSGLFGTPDRCLQQVEHLAAIGVDEIACLVDFGIATDVVLEHLPYLNQVRERSARRAQSGSGYTIAAQIARHGVTHLQGTPSLIRTVLADEAGRASLTSLKCLLVGGEPLPPALAAEMLPLLRGRLLNMYGPTETTVWSTVAPINDCTDITIGRPIANTQIYIVDATGNPQPIGVAGELLIGGLGVTRGYWNRPDLTAERFIVNPCLPERGDLVYRTGDLARYRPDGRIECLGRIDHQVKIGGHRIELGEIETVLGSHPSVSQAVVTVRPDPSGEPRLVAYVVPRVAQRSADEGNRWQSVWDETYKGLGGTVEAADPTFDISGWRNSYTGEPMPVRDMREWVEGTVNRIMAAGPRRVLEIGCGAGLLLHRVAPRVDHYGAIDFSPAAIARLQGSVSASGLTNVTLRVATADQIASQADLGPVDVVVINSVLQYFADVDYLIDVLGQAVSMVRPGGKVFVGDVRDLRLLEAFHTSVELFRAPATMTTAELRQLVRDRVENDPELIVDPAFFKALQGRVTGITRTDILLKPGRARNELTGFRYDAVLTVGGVPTAPGRIDSMGASSAEDIASRLRSAGGPIAIRNICNPRLVTALAALDLLRRADGPATVAELRQRLPGTVPRAVEPDDVVGAADGWDVDLTWASDGSLGDYDAVCRPSGTPPVADPSEPALRAWREYAREPRTGRAQHGQALKAHLRSSLPSYMVPASIVFLDALPLTPNGKIDRQALPEPGRQRHEPGASYVEPGSEFERMIAETWQDLLAVDRVGIHDNFFDIGANSLLMVQAHGALRDRLARPLSLVDLFRFPTVRTLAQFLGQAEAPSASAALAASEARGQARLGALGRRRAGRAPARQDDPRGSQ